MQRWEYLTVWFRVDELPKFQAELNQFGELGWELISLTPIESKQVGIFDSGSATSTLVAVFKRPKP
jgi:Domain of unknown function (DUF4177)